MGQQSSSRFVVYESDKVQESRQLLEVIDRVGKQPILVALSALITGDIRERCLAAGFTEVLESPLTIQKI